MSGAGTTRRSLLPRLIQLGVIFAVFVLVLASTRALEIHGIGTIAAIGCLLLGGTMFSELTDLFGLPHLTGYLLAGMIAGPYGIGLLHHQELESLSSVNALALALIAFAGGAELKIEKLREGLKGLATATVLQSLVVLVEATAAFMLARPLLPFTQSLTLSALFGAGLLWGVLSVTRSPSATLGILSQTRATGPLATFSLGFVMISDVVVLVLLATVMTVARMLVDPGATISFAVFADLGHDILGTVALGTTLGLIIAAYMRLVGRQLLVVFIAFGFGLTEVLHYLHFEPLLAFLTAGFLVQNFSQQGEKFLHEIEKLGSVVFIVFFATAGAHLDIPLLAELWPVALLLCALRALATVGAARLSSRIARDPPVIRRWGWSSLVSQAGLAIGVSAVIERNFPSFGAGFRALALATVAVNEMIGPVLFKRALDRTGETVPAGEARPGDHAAPGGPDLAASATERRTA